VLGIVAENPQRSEDLQRKARPQGTPQSAKVFDKRGWTRLKIHYIRNPYNLK